jgi:hypothetical protein
LHPPVDEVQGYCWPVKLAPIKHLEQLFNLYHFGASRPYRPALLLLRDLRDVIGDEWLLLLLYIGPLFVPISHGRVEGYIKVLGLHSIMKVQVSSPSYLGSSRASFLLQAEKVPPQIEVGLDAEK